MVNKSKLSNRKTNKMKDILQQLDNISQNKPAGKNVAESVQQSDKKQMSKWLNILNENEQITISPQTGSQVIKQGNKVVGTASTPQAANELKKSIETGEVDLGDDLKEDGTASEKFMVKINGTDWRSFDSYDTACDIADSLKRKGVKTEVSPLEEKPTKELEYHKIYNPKLHHMGDLDEGMYTENNDKEYDLESELGDEEFQLDLDEPQAEVQPQPESSADVYEQTLDDIVQDHKAHVKQFIKTDELPHELFDVLFDYYSDRDMIPYGIMKGRTGDPRQFVADLFDRDLSSRDSDSSEEMEYSAAVGRKQQDDEARMQFESWSKQLSSYLMENSNSDEDVEELDEDADCEDKVELDEEISISTQTNLDYPESDSVDVSASGDDADAILSLIRSMSGSSGVRIAGADSTAQVVATPAVAYENMYENDYANSDDDTVELSNETIMNMGNDLHRVKKSQAVGNQVQIADDIAVMKRLSGY